MARKGKTLSRTLRKEFANGLALPKSLFFLHNVKYTAIAEVLLEGKIKPKILVEFTPTQLKALMESRIYHLGGGAHANLRKRESYGIYKRPPKPKPPSEEVAEAHRVIQEQRQIIEELNRSEECSQRSIRSKTNLVREIEQRASDLERDLVESRKIYQSALDENRKLKEKIDQLLGKEGRMKNSTDKQVNSLDPNPYKHRLPGSHG
ncbi:hypothetical protein ABI582_16105 [Pseudomonas sp. SAS7]|uniref:hypothetical protein n=1 Tax=Pseudomonas sp. SAS7 TaxID=3156487 RepID=UPI003F9C9A37